MEEEEKFKIGDRVVVFDEFTIEQKNVVPTFQWMMDIPKPGDKGTVCNIYSKLCIGVDFDRALESSHDCHGTAREGHGFYLHPDRIKHVEKILNIKEWIIKKK